MMPAPIAMALVSWMLAAAPPTAAAAERPLVRCRGVAAPTLQEETGNLSVARNRTERAARADAVRACLAKLRALPLARGTVGDRLDGDAALAHEVEKVVRSTRPADAPRLFSDGGAAIELAVALDGALSRLVLGTPTWIAPGAPAGGR